MKFWLSNFQATLVIDQQYIDSQEDVVVILKVSFSNLTHWPLGYLNEILDK